MNSDSLMKRTNSILTLILVSLIASTSIGCFGLVPIRESLELMRGEPITVEIDQKTNISYTFQSAQSEPYENISNYYTDWWRKKTNTALSYVSGDHYLVAAVSSYSKDRPAADFLWPQTSEIWIDRETAKKHGRIILSKSV